MTDAVLAQAAELTRLLDLEFDALKNQDLDLFESLQPGKSELLGQLGQSCPPPEDLQNEAACMVPNLKPRLRPRISTVTIPL